MQELSGLKSGNFRVNMVHFTDMHGREGTQMTELTSIDMLTTQICWIQRQEEPLPSSNKGGHNDYVLEIFFLTFFYSI